MSKTEQLLRGMFIALLPNQYTRENWWQDIREKAGIEPFEPDCPDHLLVLMDYYLKIQQKTFEKITAYCEKEMRKEDALTTR